MHSTIDAVYIATNLWTGAVCLSVCLSVCLLGTPVNPVKTGESGLEAESCEPGTCISDVRARTSASPGKYD